MIALRAAGMASNGGEALRVLGRRAVLGRPGLEWPCGGCAGWQERVPDDSIGHDVYSILLSIADVKVVRAVHVVGDIVM
jgi:hypothetical protein